MLAMIGAGTSRRDDAGRTPPQVVALLRERRRRLAAIPRYDRYIAEAEGNLTLQAFWRNLKRQELEDAQRIAARLDREPARAASDARKSITARYPAEPEEVGHATTR